jgi:hypothetical protein
MCIIEQEILRGNLIENLKWAKDLNELLGADNKKAQQQWSVCNEITKQLNNVILPKM